MSSVLHVKPEEMDTAEKRGRYTIAIIGCDLGAVLYAVIFAEAGFKVICADADQTAVKLFNKGKIPFIKHELESKLKNCVRKNQLTATNDLKEAASQSDIIVVTTSVKSDEKRKGDYSEIENVCKQVGSVLRRGSLVIFGGIAGFGFTEDVLKQMLENTSGFRVGADFGLAFSPIQLSDSDATELPVDQELKVAALEKNSLNSASIILETIARKGVKKTLDVKTTELATLFKATKREVSLAFANELAIFCEKVGWDYLEILRFLEMEVENTNFLPSLPEENSRIEAYLLLEDADNLNMKLRILTNAIKINEEMVWHAANLTQNALRSCGKTLRRARVALLGIAKTPNMKTSPKTAARKLAGILETKGAKVSIHDPYLTESELTDMPFSFKRNLIQALEGTDCAIILTGHDHFKRLNLKKLKAVMRMPAAIVDFEGIIDPDKVEKEGFVYRGLGRGAWIK